MTTISLNEPQRTLAELVHRLAPGEVVTILEDDRPIDQIVSLPASRTRPPRPRPMKATIASSSSASVQPSPALFGNMTA
jgi:antitoxin (DNA-binding transcriptional repressor) of toxin-antitoxin stability system